MENLRFAPKGVLVLLAATLSIGIPATALATSQAPFKVAPTPSPVEPFGQGITVQSMPDEFDDTVSIITFNYRGVSADLGWALISETGDPPTIRAVAPWSNEASASDIHGDFIAFIQHMGAGGSELYAKTLSSSTVLNVTKGSSTLENYPALHTNGSTRNLVWQASTLHEELGSWSHGIMYLSTVTSTATPVSWGAGQRPAISQNIVAWEDGFGGLKYTLNRGATFQTLPASSYTERLPAVGGNRVFYERIDSSGVSTIAYRTTTNMSREYTIEGPSCTQKIKPRVSSDGQYLLFTGTGCPSDDGAQPLYLAKINSSNVQSFYLVDDLGDLLDASHDSLAPYDIDGDGIAYQHISYFNYYPVFTAYWARLDLPRL